MKKLFLAVAATALVAACGQSDSDDAGEANVADAETNTDAFANDEERILYAIGVVVADNIADLGLTAEEFEFVTEGMRDSIAGTPPRVDMALYGPQIQVFADERIQASRDAAAELAADAAADERALAAEFADEIAAEPGADQLESGVIVVPVVEGDGPNPTATDTVTVHYHGTLRDGTVFDSSVERDMPATFGLGGVIPCWTEGVQRISVGGTARLLCPPDTAYGNQGQGSIPGGAALLFEVELLSIE